MVLGNGSVRGGRFFLHPEKVEKVEHQQAKSSKGLFLGIGGRKTTKNGSWSRCTRTMAAWVFIGLQVWICWGFVVLMC